MIEASLAARTSSRPRQSEDRQKNEKEATLGSLLEETRILLPGTEVFLGFLTTLPFTDRFAGLERVQRLTYLCTFFATLFALLCFMLPAAYHRITRPIHDKRRFKAFANRFLIAGLFPLSIAIVLATWLVTSVVARELALGGAIVMTLAVGCFWWVLPLTRAHHRAKPCAEE